MSLKIKLRQFTNQFSNLAEITGNLIYLIIIKRKKLDPKQIKNEF